MADDDRDPGPPPPSLEPPSLFKRKRRPRPEPVDEQPTEVIAPVTAEPAPQPVPEPDSPTEVVATVPQPVHPPEPVHPPKPVHPPEPIPAPEPVQPPEPVRPPEPVDAPPLFADQVDSAPAPPTPRPRRTWRPGTGTTAPATADAPRASRVPREPVLTGLAAAVATGLVVGLLAVALTSGSLQVCEAARGTESCGDAGFLLLLAILIVAVVTGSSLLRWSRVPDPGSTSFLAVGLLSVVALLFLVEHLLEWWMLIVIPVVGMAAYAASYRVTMAVIEPARE